MFIDRGEAKGHIRNNHYDNNVNIEIEKKKSYRRIDAPVRPLNGNHPLFTVYILFHLCFQRPFHHTTQLP